MSAIFWYGIIGVIIIPTVITFYDDIRTYWFNIIRPQSFDGENLQTWTTMDGRILRVCDMTDDHLRNTIFYMSRRQGELVGVETAQAQLPLGKTAVLSLTPSDRWPIYDVLRREANRRRLTWI